MQPLDRAGGHAAAGQGRPPEEDDLICNPAAEKVTKNHNTPINDRHSVATRWDGSVERKKGNDVHFPGAAYAKQAEQIAGKILEELEVDETKRSSPRKIL